MPDFTIEHHYVCTSVDSPGSVGGYIQELKHVPFDGPCWTCSCKAFQFQKKPIPDRCCKHLKQLFEERCAWEQFYDGGKLTPMETDDNAGNPTHWRGCANCCKFDHGVPADIYEWVNEDGGKHYSQYEKSNLAWKIYRFRLHEQNKTKEVPD